jgi:hypothetical protein
MSIVHPVLYNPVVNPIVGIDRIMPWRAGFSFSDLPRLGPGEKFLIDDSYTYLTDENGTYLIGEEE